MTQFLRDQASDTEEVVTPLMQDGTYLSRNFATLGPLTLETPCVTISFILTFYLFLGLITSQVLPAVTNDFLFQVLISRLFFHEFFYNKETFILWKLMISLFQELKITSFTCNNIIWYSFFVPYIICFTFLSLFYFCCFQAYNYYYL